MSSGRG